MTNFKRIKRGSFCFYGLEDLQPEASLWMADSNNRAGLKRWRTDLECLLICVCLGLNGLSCFLSKQRTSCVSLFFSLYLCSWFVSSLTILLSFPLTSVFSLLNHFSISNSCDFSPFICCLFGNSRSFPQNSLSFSFSKPSAYHPPPSSLFPYCKSPVCLLTCVPKGKFPGHLHAHAVKISSCHYSTRSLWPINQWLRALSMNVGMCMFIWICDIHDSVYCFGEEPGSFLIRKRIKQKFWPKSFGVVVVVAAVAALVMLVDDPKKLYKRNEWH